MQSNQIEGDLLVVAGEASGDLHGARLMTELQQMAPGLRSFGLGGRELEAAGTELIADSSEISVVGISEVIRVLPRAREIFHQILQEVDRRQTRIALLIDFPDFNLRLAKALDRRGVKVLYYISPQIWAWRRGRVRTIARLIDRMLVILPFEVDFYHRHGIEAVHVGHPLIDEVPQIPQRWDQEPAADEPYVIALLPGSRSSEIAANLPVMLAAAERLKTRYPCEFRLIKAPTVAEKALDAALSGFSLEPELVRENRFEAIAASHLAICASGTATLEVGLLRTPMVMVYRVSPWTFLLGRLLVRLPHIALVNLVLDRRVIPELIQYDATPESIADTAAEILADRDRIRSMREDLADLRVRLGDSGASCRAATRVWQELQRRQEAS